MLNESGLRLCCDTLDTKVGLQLKDPLHLLRIATRGIVKQQKQKQQLTNHNTT